MFQDLFETWRNPVNLITNGFTTESEKQKVNVSLTLRSMVTLWASGLREEGCEKHSSLSQPLNSLCQITLNRHSAWWWRVLQVCVCVSVNAMKSFIRIRWDEEECEHTVAQKKMLTHQPHKNVWMSWMSSVYFILSSTKKEKRKKSFCFKWKKQHNCFGLVRFFFFFKEVSYSHQDCIYLIKNVIYFCDGKAEFSGAFTPYLSVIWP